MITTRGSSVLRVFAAVVAALVAVGLVVHAAGGLPDQTPATDETVEAVDTINSSMADLRATAVVVSPSQLRTACLLEGLSPDLAAAYRILAADRRTAPSATVWRDSYWDGLVTCHKGDMAGASEGLMTAFRAAETLTGIVGR